jgi:thioredoxin reductase (NADPH)
LVAVECSRMSTLISQLRRVGVIGAGPIGLELAVALKGAGIDYLQFDAKQIGHTISWFAPGTRFFSSNERIAIAGVPLQTADQGKATREEYLAYLRSVVLQHDLQVRTFEPVEGIVRRGEEFVLTTQSAAGAVAYRFSKLVLCTGGTATPRVLDVPGENLPHVSHYFQDPHTYFRKRLLIVGGRNSAVEAALRCHHAGAEVSISYRRSEFEASSIKYWLLPEINGLISAGRIRGHFNTVVSQITPSTVTLGPCGGGAGKEEPFDFVLLLTGYEADMSLMKKAGVELQSECQIPVFNEQTMETNVPGVYLAGCAIGGTQSRYKIFLENCHVHVPRIVAALSGAAPPMVQEPKYAGAES